MKTLQFLAFDFGAESGRAILGKLDNGILTLQEVHRFPNEPVKVIGHLHWDVLKLFAEVKKGLKIAHELTDGKINGIGVDTWGVDFGLIDENGELLGNPYHYRDSRNDGMIDKVCKFIPKEEIYEQTGIQFLPFNTIYQLYAMKLAGNKHLTCAQTLLFMPDLFNYWLTGKKFNELSIASTSQLYNPRTKNWSYFLLDKLEIPKCIFADFIQPGNIIGSLEPNLANDLGVSADIDVIAPASHDTGSAIAAVPASSDGFAYLSSGTWSLMGVELKEPMLSNKAYSKDFTNEGGVNGTIRFLRNIMGLWILQEIRRTWLAEGDDISYAEITSIAGELNHSESLINPDLPEFLPPGNMPQRVKDFCSRTNQKVPETKAEIVRCVLDSLAFKYRSTLEDLEEVLEKKLDPLHIVGGGTQNKLLSQLTANAIGRNVIAGPVEATAIGNLLVQAMGKGVVSSLEEIRTIVSNSFEVETFIPKPQSGLEESYKKFLDICNQ